MTRPERLLHAGEVLTAVLVGWLINTKPAVLAILPGACLLSILVIQYCVSSTQANRTISIVLDSFVRVIPFRGNVRATIHAPTRRGGKYRQILDYVPGGQGGGRGRKFDNDLGIVGKCIVRRGELVENFPDEEAFNTHMVSDYGYTVEEMSRRSRTRRSYFVKAIEDGPRLLGVLYLDSDVYREFPSTTVPSVRTMLDALTDEIGMLGLY